MDKVKILFVVNAFGTASGAEHVLVDFLKSEERIEPFFLIVGDHKDVPNTFLSVIDKSNIVYIDICSKIQTRISRLMCYRFFRHILLKKIKRNPLYIDLNNRKDIQTVYFNNSFESSVFYPLFPHKAKVVHIHDMIDMFRLAQRECLVSVCKSVSQIITVSYACKEMLAKHGINPQKIAVAHNSISLQPEPYITKDNNILTIGFVGSAIYRKGFDLFVSIINRIQGEINARSIYKDFSVLVITNSDSNNPYLCENISKLDGRIKKQIYSKIDREMVFSLYKEMDMLLVPSRYDPLPTVVLEGYMKGVPVLGTAKDGMLEMQISNAMMFKNEDVEDAVASIFRWLNLPSDEKKTIVEKTQQHIMQEFTEQNKREIIYDAIENVRGKK